MINRLKDEKGFTLIEAMISAGILAVGLLATLQLMSVAVNGTRKGKDVTVATNLAKQVIEEMKNSGYATAINHMSSTFRNISGYTFQNATFPNPAKQAFPGEVIAQQQVNTSNKTYTILTDVTENSPMYKLVNVSVTVSWSTAGKNHAITYRTYLNK